MSSRCTLPAWLAERAAVGEAPGVALPPAQRAELEASDRAILDALPPAMVAAEIERRARAAVAAADRAPRRLVLGAAIAAAMVAVVLLAIGRRQAPAVADGGEVVRIKGDARLVVHRKHGDRVERLSDGAPAAAGDVVQLSYVAAGQRFGAIVSVDGRGAVTVHLPASGSPAAELGQGGAVPLADAYELDDAPGFERFLLITAGRPFSVDTVRDAAARLARTPAHARSHRLELPAALAQHSFVLRKEPAPKEPPQ